VKPLVITYNLAIGAMFSQATFCHLKLHFLNDQFFRLKPLEGPSCGACSVCKYRTWMAG